MCEETRTWTEGESVNILKTILFLLCLLTGNVFAGNQTDITTEAGAISNSSTTFMGTPPSPTIGLTNLPNSLPPQLLSQLPAPPYVLYGRLLELTAQFGDIVITGKEELAQITVKEKISTVTFAPSPQFAKYRKTSNLNWSEGNLSARFANTFNDRVNWLGTVIVSSKNGDTLMPTAAMQAVRNAIESSSSANLKEVVIIPIPDGYGVNVGVSSEANAGGLASSLAKITSIFLGIGPSWSTQSGTTMPTATWSQQYIVFEKDANGIPFSIERVTRQEEQKVVTPTAPPVDEVAVAREAARKMAETQALVLAMKQLNEAKLALTVSVPTDRVVQKRVPCKLENFTDADGKKVSQCRGSTSGFYNSTQVIRETAIGQSTVNAGTSSDKK